jgi:hypothetical protein
MKFTNAFTVLTVTLGAAFLSVPVYAMDKCEALFAPKELRQMSAVQAKVKKQTLELRALKAWEQAILDRNNSVDPAHLQEVILDAEVPESKGIKRVSITWLKGVFEPVKERETRLGPLFRPKGKFVQYGERKYVEFPNSTMMTTADAQGNTRTWVLTRGVRFYKDRVNRITGEINPRGYVSDVLLFEMVKGKPKFHSVYLESAPELKFMFEDPRISIVPDGKGGQTYLLSGTDYSPHIGPTDNPKRNPDVMNRYIELKINSRTGEPQPIHVDPKTRLPEFEDLSPAPVKIKEAFTDSKGDFHAARYRTIDAKNATVSVNENGEVVVLARLRPDFTNDPEMVDLFDHRPWDYAEQTFLFRNWDEFKAYDRRDLMVDLAGKASSEKTFGKIRPVIARELVRDKDLHEYLKVRDQDLGKLEIIKGQKGMGPGTRPLRIQRIGDLLLASDGPGLPMYVHEVLLPSERETYPMKEGEVVYVKLDHEIRKIYQQTPSGKLKRRHYSAVAKILDSKMAEMTDYLPDVVQPKNEYELGKDSGILDLLHVYPMGIGITPKAGMKLSRVTPEMLQQLATLRAKAQSGLKDDRLNYETQLAKVSRQAGNAKILATAGISDAHTSIWEVNWKTVIREAREFTASLRRQ